VGLRVRVFVGTDTGQALRTHGLPAPLSSSPRPSRLTPQLPLRKVRPRQQPMHQTREVQVFFFGLVVAYLGGTCAVCPSRHEHTLPSVIGSAYRTSRQGQPGKASREGQSRRTVFSPSISTRSSTLEHLLRGVPLIVMKAKGCWAMDILPALFAKHAVCYSPTPPSHSSNMATSPPRALCKFCSVIIPKQGVPRQARRVIDSLQARCRDLASDT